MINSSLKEKYWDSATDKQMVISVVGTNQKIDNSMLEIGTFALEESLCSESELKFGACEANCVKFTARNTAGSIIGKTISIEETIDGDIENPMPYGVFKVASDVPTADRTKRQITAYDAMYDIINTDVKSWYAGLSFPMTLKQFRNSFFAHLGIAQVETNLVNDSITVNKTIVATQTDDSSAVTEEPAISGKTVVTAICEINGCFGNINREGKFEYVFLKAITSALYPAEDLFPSDNLFPSDANTESMTGHYITFDYEDFKSKAITQLEIKTSEDNAGAIVGTAGNNYSITGNFLVSDKTGAELEQIANNLLPIMAEAEYTPIKSCTCVGNPCLTLGDPIRFNTTREIVETYLLQRTLTGVQSKRDSISAQGTQTHSAKVNSIRDTIESVERRTGKLERNADHLQSTYEDLEKQTSSKFEQTASGFEMSVTGGDKTVGIVIKLLNSDGDVISESSENANITITGVVRFEDLANSGSTTINGDNITTGTIRGTNSEFTNVKFLEKVYYRYQYGGQLYDYPIFNVDQLGILDFCGSGVHVNFGGSWLFKDSRVYLGSMASNNQLATIGDIPTTKDLDNRYMHDKVSGGSDGTGSIFVHSITYSSGILTVTTASVSSSDERLKTNVSDMPDLESVYLKFKPKKFRFDDRLKGYDHRWHYGLLAQSVEESLIEAGISIDDTGLIWKEHVYDDFHEREVVCDEMVYKLDKDELHAMHIQMIQKQHKEIEELKRENKNLSERMKDFEQRLSALERK